MGKIKETPEVLAQGTTVQETKSNILDALQLCLEDMQQEKEEAELILEEPIEFYDVS